MDRIIGALTSLRDINAAYSRSNERVEELLNEAASAKVCTPIIGRFSSGKSALINAILGYSKRLLRVGITPATAVPAEIAYVSENDAEAATIFRMNGTSEKMSIDEYRDFDASAADISHVRLDLCNSRLKEFPDVMLVDMPGFESGFEVHNKAIDDYLPQSLAYLIAFPADDMIIRRSVGDILNELCLNEKPICIIITKYDKKNDDFDGTLSSLKESLKRYTGDNELIFCRTSSMKDGNVDDVVTFLKKLQEESQSILVQRFRPLVLSVLEDTETYLTASLKSGAMSESELNEQAAKLDRQLERLESRFSAEKENFSALMVQCAEEVKGDVRKALEAEHSTFVNMALDRQDLSEKMNTVVRCAVTASMKKRFVPKVESYLKKVADTLQSELVGDTQIAFYFDPKQIGSGVTSTVAAAGAGFLLGGPIVALIAGGLAAIVNKLRSSKQREEQRRQAEAQLRSQVYPQVMNEVGRKIEAAIARNTEQLNEAIAGEIARQRTALEQAIADTRQKLSDEAEEKEALAIQMKKDLEKIGRIKDGVQ